MPAKTIHIHYYALLREERGAAEETMKTTARTVEDLYRELQKQHPFRLSPDVLRIAVNDEFVKWNYVLRSNDRIVFIPPAAGG